MAKYNIKNTCGHVYTYNIVGPEKDRPRKEAWLATQQCPECRKAAELAEAQATTATMPALTGSDKQIAWATKLRAEVIDQFEALLDRAPADQRDAARTANQPAIDWLAAHTEAKWWIDQRQRSPYGQLQDAAKAVNIG